MYGGTCTWCATALRQIILARARHCDDDGDGEIAFRSPTSYLTAHVTRNTPLGLAPSFSHGRTVENEGGMSVWFQSKF